MSFNLLHLVFLFYFVSDLLLKNGFLKGERNETDGAEVSRCSASLSRFCIFAFFVHFTCVFSFYLFFSFMFILIAWLHYCWPVHSFEVKCQEETLRLDISFLALNQTVCLICAVIKYVCHSIGMLHHSLRACMLHVGLCSSRILSP